MELRGIAVGDSLVTLYQEMMPFPADDAISGDIIEPYGHFYAVERRLLHDGGERPCVIDDEVGLIGCVAHEIPFPDQMRILELRLP